jgi:hypothetical protein
LLLFLFTATTIAAGAGILVPANVDWKEATCTYISDGKLLHDEFRLVTWSVSLSHEEGPDVVGVSWTRNSKYFLGIGKRNEADSIERPLNLWSGKSPPSSLHDWIPDGEHKAMMREYARAPMSCHTFYDKDNDQWIVTDGYALHHFRYYKNVFLGLCGTAIGITILFSIYSCCHCLIVKHRRVRHDSDPAAV